MEQILASPSVMGKIDELFFEHHVHRSPLHFHSWRYSVDVGMSKGNRQNSGHQFDNLTHPLWYAGMAGRVRADNDITASYEILHTLREWGVRSHGWV